MYVTRLSPSGRALWILVLAGLWFSMVQLGSSSEPATRRRAGERLQRDSGTHLQLTGRRTSADHIGAEDRNISLQQRTNHNKIQGEGKGIEIKGNMLGTPKRKQEGRARRNSRRAEAKDRNTAGKRLESVTSCNSSTCFNGSCASDGTCTCFDGFKGPTCNKDTPLLEDGIPAGLEGWNNTTKRGISSMWDSDLVKGLAIGIPVGLTVLISVSVGIGIKNGFCMCCVCCNDCL